MITLFSTPKAFTGHINMIQRNAIRSWQRLDSDIEIILVGDDPGAAEVCKEFGIRHIGNVAKNRYGTKYLASIYDQVHDVAKHQVFCHVNCDILLKSDFTAAVRTVVSNRSRFLMAGRRWDVEIPGPVNFEASSWENDLDGLARKTNRPRPAQWIDYFLFSKGLYYQQIPEFVIGRPGWDNWLLWYPLSQGVPVIDASSEVVAVHQNHDYGYHPDGEKGVWQGEEAQENYRLHQGKFATLANATHVLRSGKLKRNYKAGLVHFSGQARAAWSRLWFAWLDATRGVRHRLGLRSRSTPTRFKKAKTGAQG
ncbi:MAG TPA: hypothetical protein VFN20_04150 [Candidatus Acidoferrum sp.]|nr:hypothetical protein [Candidatus Acidoferrum sp.]